MNCPCSKEIKAIGGCACDNIEINSECRAMMSTPEKKFSERPSTVLMLHELKLTQGKQKLRSKAVYRKTNKIK